MKGEATWTPERRDRLDRMLLQGLPRSRIAEALSVTKPALERQIWRIRHREPADVLALSGRPWTPEEDQSLLHDWRALVTIEESARRLNRTVRAVEHRRRWLRNQALRRPKKVTPPPEAEQKPAVLGDEEFARLCREAGGFWGRQRNDVGPVYRYQRGQAFCVGTWGGMAPNSYSQAEGDSSQGNGPAGPLRDQKSPQNRKSAAPNAALSQVL